MLHWIEDYPLPEKLHETSIWRTTSNSMFMVFSIEWITNKFVLKNSYSNLYVENKDLDCLKKTADKIYREYVTSAFTRYENELAIKFGKDTNLKKNREQELIETNNRYLEAYRSVKSLLISVLNGDKTIEEIKDTMDKGDLPSIYKNP
jgi:hypothetical protein